MAYEHRDSGLLPLLIHAQETNTEDDWLRLVAEMRRVDWGHDRTFRHALANALEMKFFPERVN